MPSDTIFLLPPTVFCPEWSCACFMQHKILVHFEGDHFQFTHVTRGIKCCTQCFEYLSYETVEALFNGDHLSLNC